jgi:hypothetical protein
MSNQAQNPNDKKRQFWHLSIWISPNFSEISPLKIKRGKGSYEYPLLRLALSEVEG